MLNERIWHPYKIHIDVQSRRRVGRTTRGDGSAGDRTGNGRWPRRDPSGGEEDDEPKYVSLRVPKSEYDKLKDLRGRMEKKPDYSWVGSLALGAFVGLAAGLALERLTRSDGDNDDCE